MVQKGNMQYNPKARFDTKQDLSADCDEEYLGEGCERSWVTLLRKVVALFVSLLMLIVLIPGASAGELVVHFLDVGQGDSIAIQSPSGTWALIDAGEEAAGRQVVVPYLKGQGVAQLELVVMTHPHADHIGGLLEVVGKLPIRSIIADGQIHTSATYERLLLAIRDKNIPFSLARKGQMHDLGGGAVLTVLHPKALVYDNLNNNGVVTRLDFGAVSLLFTGDVEVPVEQELLHSGAKVASQVLKVGHHGSETSTSAPFVGRVGPAVAVISAGEGNRYGHPAAGVVQRLQSQSVRVYRTDQHGTVVVRTDGKTTLTIATRAGTHSISLSQGGAGQTQASVGSEPLSSPQEADQNSGSGGKVNINTATYAQLQQLPGVGPVLAQRIIEYRSEQRFTSVDQLVRVKGIGAKKLEELKTSVSVE